MTIILKKLISAYHLLVSPWLGNRCRFVPTCSDYAIQALDQHDVVTATVMTAKRLCRCHPWGGHGYDPVSQLNELPKDDSLDIDNTKIKIITRQTLQKKA